MSCDPGRMQGGLLWCLKTGKAKPNEEHFFRGREKAIAGAATRHEGKIVDGCWIMLEDHDKATGEIIGDCHREAPGSVLAAAREILELD